MLEIDQYSYEERADYILDDDILKWNVDIPYFNSIQKKLIEKGSKVIVGPRGAGKTHQMKIAYNTCISKPQKPFPVYVSFSKYYHLEPLLSKNPTALTIFHTWVLCKILMGCNDTVNRILNTDANFSCDTITKESIKKFISQSEKNVQETWHSDIIRNITIQFVLDFLMQHMAKCKKTRVVLFLDDAALTLTKDYMIEFFDIFRSLKTTHISPKASVYPGTTEYGPRFHLKQDGDPFTVWFEPESEEYTNFINELCNKRFNQIKIEDNIKSLLKYASFGNPRAFITLLRDYEESSLKHNQQQAFIKIINDRCKLLKEEYLSIKQKLVQYATIIDTGWEFFEALLSDVTEANKKIYQSNEKQIIIGFREVKDNSLDRMINFLIEAGLLFELSPVKHGDSREYRRYIPHLIFLLQRRAFSKGKGFSIVDILEFLSRKNVKHPIRKDNVYNILGNDRLKDLNLDLPSCTHCGANRLNEAQKFCHACGHELSSRSSYEKCMELTIDQLPLTEWTKDKIKKETSLKTVQDIISRSDISDELRRPYGIGEKKAEKIFDRVIKYIEEFLA